MADCTQPCVALAFCFRSPVRSPVPTHILDWTNTEVRLIRAKILRHAFISTGTLLLVSLAVVTPTNRIAAQFPRG